MIRLLSSVGWRKVVILGAGIVIGAAALAMMVDSDRERAIAAAKEHGNRVGYRGQLLLVELSNRKAVDAVLPLLKDVPELTELRIGGVDLTSGDLNAISQLTSLTALGFDGCGLSGEETDPLGNLTNVTRINLIRNPLTDRGMRFMSSMKSLEKVDLSFTPIHGEGIEYLVGLPNLRELWLTRTKINNDTLGLCARLSRLKVLYVSETEVTTDGLMHLVDLHWLETLAVPDRTPRADRGRIGEAFINSRRKARAAGEDVPAHDRPPIGSFF